MCWPLPLLHLLTTCISVGPNHVGCPKCTTLSSHSPSLSLLSPLEAELKHHLFQEAFPGPPTALISLRTSSVTQSAEITSPTWAHTFMVVGGWFLKEERRQREEWAQRSSGPKYAQCRELHQFRITEQFRVTGAQQVFVWVSESFVTFHQAET